MASTTNEKPSTISAITSVNPSTDSLVTPLSTHQQQPPTYDPTSTNPFSPFYSHERASQSSRRLQQQSSSISHNDQYDLEKNLPITVTETQKSHKSTLSTANPNKPSLLCKSSAKKTRGCWRNMSKKRRIAVHVLIALLFVGAVTGLGLGVSKAMGTGIWKGADGGSAGLQDV